MKVLAVKDETDDRITTFISKYAALSDKIKVEWIDPVLHPSALTDYDLCILRGNRKGDNHFF